jgi:large subunit ribosomal protein L6
MNILPDKIECEGPKGKLTAPLLRGIRAKIEDNQILLTRRNDSKQQRSTHGLNRTLVSNAVVGVSTGFSKQLEIVGVGYRAKVERDRLELNVGYSRPIIYEIPQDVEIVCEKPTLITVQGIDKQRVGQVAEEIRRFRKPEPYKLKGIRYVGERLIKKERKTGVGVTGV